MPATLRSLYGLALESAGEGDTCIICLADADVIYEDEAFCAFDGAERFSDHMFHAKVYSKTVGAHSA